MSRLDKLIEHARTATVDREAAERYVRELDRWARPAARPEQRPWRWLMLGTGLGLAAAAIALVVLWPGAVDDAVPVRIGPRVALVADPDSRYHVVQADRDATLVELERGAVTARLWPGEHHRLSLTGLGVTANAVGTVYSLALRDGHPVVHVVEGIVEVRAPDGIHMVRADETWPSQGKPARLSAGAVLLRLAAPPPPPPPVDAPATNESSEVGVGILARGDAGPDASAGSDDAGPDASAGSAHPGDAPHHAIPHPSTGAGSGTGAASIKERWRQARLLRGQGKFADALSECVSIGDAHDAIWSPIALVEAVRIALGPLSTPERAVELADRVLRDWPKDPLATEARVLRCRALSQLGRECNAPSAGSGSASTSSAAGSASP